MDPTRVLRDDGGDDEFGQIVETERNRTCAFGATGLVSSDVDPYHPLAAELFRQLQGVPGYFGHTADEAQNYPHLKLKLLSGFLLIVNAITQMKNYNYII